MSAGVCCFTLDSLPPHAHAPPAVATNSQWQQRLAAGMGNETERCNKACLDTREAQAAVSRHPCDHKPAFRQAYRADDCIALRARAREREREARDRVALHLSMSMSITFIIRQPRALGTCSYA